MENFNFEQLISTWFGLAVFSALLQALPPPNGNKWYNFLYRFLHALAANWDRMRTPVKKEDSVRGGE